MIEPHTCEKELLYLEEDIGLHLSIEYCPICDTIWIYEGYYRDLGGPNHSDYTGNMRLKKGEYTMKFIIDEVRRFDKAVRKWKETEW